MKLRFDVQDRNQPDPYIFEDEGKFYLFVTARDGVEAYEAEDPFGIWRFRGTVCTLEGAKDYWAPCILKHGGKYYLYFSCSGEDFFEYLHCAEGETPLGPYKTPVRMFDRFTIDAHVVENEAGMFLFYAEDNRAPERFGTRIFLDKLTDPFTPAGLRKEILVPTRDEEIFQRNREGDGRDWHTLEGPFWLCEGGYQYVMYSGGCFLNDTYHIGYASAKYADADLTNAEFEKAGAYGKFTPVLIKNDREEGTGHHSVLKYKGEYYCIYHGRDMADGSPMTDERRTARICRLEVKDGCIKAERM